MKIYAEEISKKIGEEIAGIFVAGKIRTSSNSNAVTWNNISLSDKTGTVEGIIWQTEMQDVYRSYAGTYVQVQAQVTLYNGKPLLTIAHMAPASNVDPSDFVSRIEPDVEKELKGRLQSLIKDVKNSTLNAVLRGIFSEKMVDCCLSKPAALVYHHAFNGGLLVHSIETAEIARSMAEIENSFSHIRKYHNESNTDLVISGALLHDIGKIYTLSSFPFAKKTERGLFLGHVTESIKLIHGIYKKICTMNENPDSDSVMKLEHIVRAAHEKETAPRIKEALIVRAANKASSMMDAADTALKDADGPTVYNGYLNTTLFVPGKEEE